MKNKIILTIAGCCCALAVLAGEPLRQPLNFVPSDSVLTWGLDRSDFRATALSVAPELRPSPVAAGSADRAAFHAAATEWKEKMLPRLSILGGLPGDTHEAWVLQTAGLVKLAGKLFLQTADAHYMDVLERCALNALLPSLTPGGLTLEKHVAARALMAAGGMAYATDDKGVFVNLYINSMAHIKTGHLDFMIDQMTDMPHHGRVKLRISGFYTSSKAIRLRLRMPAWACRTQGPDLPFVLQNIPERLPVIYVNGREEFYQLNNGYLEIDRKWNSGDEVFFDLPLDAREVHVLKGGKPDTTRLAFQYGPLVYGYNTPAEGAYVRKTDRTPVFAGYNKSEHNTFSVPLETSGSGAAALKIEPVMDGVKYIWTHVRQ